MYNIEAPLIKLGSVMAEKTVSTEVRGVFSNADHRPQITRVRLIFFTKDPLCIFMRFPDNEDPEILWILGRELLEAALQTSYPVGWGRVRFYTPAGTPTQLVVRLQGRADFADIQLARPELTTFMERIRSAEPVPASQAVTAACAAWLAGLLYS